jgi:DNA-binding GntR family transcriptional regulator
MTADAARIKTPVDGHNVELVHDRIRTAILRDELPPGEEISQVRLAKELGVSRTPLREALRMLVTEGLVEGEPNHQLRVTAFSIEDMEELYVSRVALEATAIRITIPRLTGKDIAIMEGLLAQMTHFAGEEDYEEWEGPHRELHLAMHQYAGQRVIDILTQLSEYAERYRRAYTTGSDRSWADGLAEHRRIVKACKARDSDAGARALAEHLGHTAIGVIDLVDPSYSPVALRIAISAASAVLEAEKKLEPEVDSSE